MSQPERLLLRHEEAFAPLNAAFKEASRRMKQAETAVADGQARLDADLAAGRDTSTSRRTLHEARRLLNDATMETVETFQALSFATLQAISKQADALAENANAEIQQSLSRFNIKEYARGN